MKQNIVIAVTFILFFMGIANGQNFSVVLNNTEISDTLGSEVIFDFEITNTSDSELSLYFLRYQNDLPEGWSSSLCFSNCFAPHLDSIVTSAQYGSSPLEAGSSRHFSVHVFLATTEGTSEISIRIANLNDPNEQNNYLLKATSLVTSVNDKNILDDYFKLNQNYPNPFNPTTKISFNLKESGDASLKVYDILGNLVDTILDQYMASGEHAIDFNGADLASGVYIYELKVNNLIQTKKMVLGK